VAPVKAPIHPAGVLGATPPGPLGALCEGCEGIKRFLCNRFLCDKCPLEIPLLNCEATRRVPAGLKADSTISALVSRVGLGYKRRLSFHQTEMLDGQTIKTSSLDSDRCAHLENLRQKEDASIKHCPLPKTNRGGYSAKGIQPGTVPRFAGLKPLKSSEVSSGYVRGFPLPSP
jgi:hypothetical protein